MEAKNPELRGSENSRSVPDPAREDATGPRTQKTRPQGASVRRGFPGPGDLFALLGIVLGAQIVVGIIVQIVAAVACGLPAQWPDEPEVLGRTMAFSYFLSMSLALAGILVFRRIRGGRGPVAHFSRRGANPGLLGWAFALMAGLNIVLDPVVSLLPGPAYELLGRGFWTLFSLVALAPVFEEILCRGILLGAMRAKYGALTAWLVSSLFFGIMHVYPAQAVGAAVLGLVLGFVYIVTDSLWASMLLHAANNAVAYALMAAGYADADLAALLGNRTLYAAVYVAAALLAAVSFYGMFRSLSRLKASVKNPAEA